MPRLLKNMESMTIDKLIDMAYDPYLPAMEMTIPTLVTAYNQSPSKDSKLEEVIETLSAWDYAVSKESIGMTIGHFYCQYFLKDGDFPKGLSPMQKIEYIAKSSPDTEKIATLKKSIDHVSRDFGTWKTPWGEISRFQRLNGDIDHQFDDDAPSIPVGMSTARWGALAAYGMRTSQKTKRIYGTRGNSFIAAVEFGEKVKAKSLLAGGQSGDPASPHFYDQAQLYADGVFKDVLYYKEDVANNAKEKYNPGKKPS